MPFIYKITNRINNKGYIGKTSLTIEQRWAEHQKDAMSSQKNHRPLYSAIRKYGIENFIVEQIEEVSTDKEACEREIFWIEYYGTFKNGYNATKGGDGRSYADYELIYNLFQEGKTSKEIREITGHADETIKRALETKNISSEERMLRGRTTKQSVQMLNKDTLEILNIFPSITSAERFLNKPNSRRHITEVCQKKRKTAYGYKWQWAD